MRLNFVLFGERFVEILFKVPHNKPDDLPIALRYICKRTLFGEHLRIVAQKLPVVICKRTVEKALVKTHSTGGDISLFKFTDGKHYPHPFRENIPRFAYGSLLISPTP